MPIPTANRSSEYFTGTSDYPANYKLDGVRGTLYHIKVFGRIIMSIATIDAKKIDAEYAAKVKSLPTFSVHDFKCGKCGYCCSKRYRWLHITIDDIIKISRERGVSPSVFVTAFCFRVPRSGDVEDFGIIIDGGCPFLEEGVGCVIHSCKPRSCVTAPFLQTSEARIGGLHVDYGCSINQVNPDAIILYDIDAEVDDRLWTLITQKYMSTHKTVEDEEIMDAYNRGLLLFKDEELLSDMRWYSEQYHKCRVVSPDVTVFLPDELFELFEKKYKEYFSEASP
jgi:Fe-S-cluster containining protein